jgi:type VI secretion system protein ImpL
LQKFLDALKRETAFCAPQADVVPAEAAKDNAPAADPYDRLRILLNQGTPAAEGPNVVQCTNAVEQRFGELNGQASDQILGLLAQLAEVMQAAKGRGDRPPDSASAAADALVIDGVKMEAERQPDPMLSSILNGAVSGTARIASGGAGRSINEQWLALPLNVCDDTIAGRYPVVPGSQKEISLQDFGRFFGVGGIMDQFFQANLRDMVDMTRRPWRARSTGGFNILLSSGAIAMFERAAAIREAYFQGGMEPRVAFELTPAGMDASIDEFKLTLDGQTTTYFNGPIVPQLMQWPGPNSTGEVRLEMSPGQGTSMRWERGAWAWFRVLDGSGLQPGAEPERFNVTFTVGSRSARYELRARSAYNPFGSRALQEFRCERRLTR